jgi:hypothetical protein
MNDVQHFEAARALAERALGESGPTTAERINYLYRTVLARKPSEDEVRLIDSALKKQLTLFSQDPLAARKVVRSGESRPKGLASDVETAAWTMIANLVLNLDETVTNNSLEQRTGPCSLQMVRRLVSATAGNVGNIAPSSHEPG